MQLLFVGGTGRQKLYEQPHFLHELKDNIQQDTANVQR